MKASLVSLALIACSTALIAQPAPKAPHAIDPASRSNNLAKSGGLVQQPVSGPSLLFLNSQTRVSVDPLQNPCEQIRNFLRLPTIIRNTPSAEPVTEALRALDDKNTAAVVVIADVAGYPSLLVAPENRWALVNVAALGGPGVTTEKLAERVQKETWRAFGYLMGAANSNFEHCLLKPVLVPEDLDALNTKGLCPEPFNKIIAHARKLGMQPIRTTTYRKAVEEGWAPAPTNSFQQAIWSELKK